ncbi:YecA family protein [Aquincola sp. MAHUQ-54]|uniref:YecA family protein n=1 Tax=Aquincola agrisoli TaxID=3119538 RepID=A0AAW9QI43_9BURK
MTSKPLTDDEFAELDGLLATLPAPLEPLECSALDGYLVGVLLQPRPVPAARWLAHVHDVDGRPAPPGTPLDRLHALVLRRHAELNQAIEHRQWFDPWVFELDEEASPSEAVMPWVAGFATAMSLFPALMDLPGPEMLEPLATLFAHLDPEDLEDAEELLAEIETLEPPADMTEAVDGLVRSALLLADVSRPRAPARPAPRPGARGRGPARGARPGPPGKPRR